jgi:O-antigen ligase
MAFNLFFLTGAFLIALPWLNPSTIAPTASVIPLLLSWLCTAVFALTWQRKTDRLQASPDLASVAATAWLLAALLSSGMGLIQYFGATAPFAGWINQPVFGEAYANLRQRNQFASLTNMGTAALLWWVVPRGDQTREWPLPLAGFAAVLLGLGNAASGSRTGMVQLIVIVALAWLWRVPHRRPAQMWVLALVLAAYVIGTVLLPILGALDLDKAGLLARLRNGDGVCSSRITLWSNVLHLIAQKPWMGWGWGELDYAHFITLYEGNRFCDILDNAHNLPLHLAVELGVPAAFLFCGLCGFAVWRAKPWRESDPGKQMAWAVLALIAIHSMLEYPLWYGPFQMAVALSMWLVCERKMEIPAVFIGLCAALLMAFCTYAVWDYWRVGQIYRAPQERAEAYKENTLEKIRPSWLFKSQVQFAELSVTPLTPENAQHQFDLARTVLHFSPEASVAQRVIDSAELLELPEQAMWYRARLTSAFASPSQ